MRSILILVIGLLISVCAVVELTDGFRRWSPFGYPDVFQATGTPFVVQPETLISDQPIRSVVKPEGLARWNVVDAFPETHLLNGAMDMRAHPSKPQTWFITIRTGPRGPILSRRCDIH